MSWMPSVITGEILLTRALTDVKSRGLRSNLGTLYQAVAIGDSVCKRTIYDVLLLKEDEVPHVGKAAGKILHIYDEWQWQIRPQAP
jgi:hypothetical protein